MPVEDAAAAPPLMPGGALRGMQQYTKWEAHIQRRQTRYAQKAYSQLKERTCITESAGLTHTTATADAALCA